MSEPKTPVQYLLQCSETSLEDFELSRLNRAASLRKQLRDIAEEWVEAEVEAQLARWALENRRVADIRSATFRECDSGQGRRRRTLTAASHPPKPKRPALLPSLPAPVPIRGRAPASRSSSPPSLPATSGKSRNPRPDAFAAVRFFPRNLQSR